MKEILVFGHQNPDTDSVLSAITLAHLKNQLKIKAIPKILGNINNETKYVLDYFKVPKPQFLNDVKLQLKDVSYLSNVQILKTTNLLEAFQQIKKHRINAVPVVDTKQKLEGFLHINDLADFLMSKKTHQIKTTYQNLIAVLAGEKILCFDQNITGEFIIAAYESATFKESIKLQKNNILIVGDRFDIQKHAINNKIKLLIIANNFSLKKEDIALAKKNKINIIKTAYDSYTISRQVVLANNVENIMQKKNFEILHEDDYVEELRSLLKTTKQLNFPVVNKQRTVLGLVSAEHLENVTPKKVILVDHNEANQSVTGLEEAEILEIIDHHKIGNVSTNSPINFRNMIVGSTNTIIYFLYKENNIKPSPKIAGLIMAGIISDTLALKSPTTTSLDREVLEEVSKIAKVNYQTFAEKMFEAGSSIQNLTIEEILFGDFKTFNVKEKFIGLGQFKTTNPKDIKEKLPVFVKKINQEAQLKQYDILALFVVDIINNGSYVIFNSEAKSVLEQAFEIDNIKNWSFISDKTSRKQQLIPRIINALDK